MKSTKSSLAVKVISLIVCAVMLGALVFSTVSCTANESATVLFEKAAGRTIGKMESYDLVTTLLNLSKNGSIAVSAEYEDEEEDITAGGTFQLFFNSDQQKVAAALDGTFGDESIDALLTFGTDEFTVKCDRILGKAYGISFKDFENKLQKSFLNPDSDSDYALDDDTYEAVIDMINSYKDDKKIEDEVNKLADKYVKLFYKEIENNSEMTKENAKVDVLEYEELQSIAVKIAIDNKGLANVLSSLWKQAKEDKELKSFLTKNIFENAAYSDSSYDDVDELFDDLDDEIDEVVEDLEDNNVKIVVTLYLNSSSGAIMRVDASYKTEDEKAAVSVELGNKFETFEGFKITEKYDDDDEQYIYLKVTEDTKDELKVKLNQNISDDFPEITVKYDRKDGDLTITADSDEEEVVIKLNYIMKSGVHTFTFISATVDDEDIEFPGKLTVTIKEKDTMPSVDKYTDVLTLDDDAIEELIEAIQENAEDFADAID